MSAPAQTQKLPAPKGYATWLDYAVATMDVRSAQLETMDAEDGDGFAPSYDAIRAAAQDDLDTLRRHAGCAV
jgi:hypothetical protein